MDYLCDQIQILQTNGNLEYITNVLGWQDVPGIKGKKFILKKLVIKGAPPINYYDSSLEFIKGTYEGQKVFLEKEVFPYKETRLAMVIGLTSVVASLIEPKKNIGSLIMNITGKSTSGKSTIVDLSASLFGSPSTENGLVGTFNATQNFIFAMSEGRNGLPIILDDTSSNKKGINKSDLIYQFAAGQPKGRCNSDGTPQVKRNKWGGVVIITSESPLVDEEQLNTGALVRTLTIENTVWTQDASHSDRLKGGARENFGFIGYEYAKFVGRKNLDTLYKLHDKSVETILNKMINKDALSARMASKMAPIISTAVLFNEFYGKKIVDANEIADMIVEQEQNSFKTRDINEEFYETLLCFISANKNHFDVWYEDERPDKEKVEYQVPTRLEKYGSIHYLKKDSYLLFNELCFKKFLNTCEITEWNNIKKVLAERGILIKRDNKHFAWRSNKKLNATHYKFIIKEYDEDNRSERCVTNLEENSSSNLTRETPKSKINYYNQDDIDDIFKE